MDTALGSYEAACLLGVHFTQPAVIARRGVLRTRLCRSLPKGATVEREFAVYSSTSVHANWEDYVRGQQEPGRPRPRTRESLRPAMERRLKKAPQIEFSDAIGSAEAAEIMGCTAAWAIHLVRDKHVVGRLLHSDRRGPDASRRWIFSRKSCEEHAAEVRREIRAGTKIGRPRVGLRPSLDQ